MSANALTKDSNTVVSAMAIMVTAMLFLPCMDAIAKYLSTSEGISPTMTTFSRFVFQSVSLFAVLLIFPARALGSRRNILLNVLRGLLVGTAVMIFFTAIKYMPLADAIAIFFVEPLIVLILSPFLLGEQVGWRRRLAAIIGFVGAVLVIQPSYETFGPVSLMPLLTAFFFALYLILTKKTGANDDPVMMQFYSGIGAILTLSGVMMVGQAMGLEDFSPSMPTTQSAVLLLLLIGIIATIGHLMIVVALTKAPASILAPFQYVEIIAATGLGFLIFAEFPNLLQWVGIAIIIGSGLYTFWREQKLEKTTTPPAYANQQI